MHRMKKVIQVGLISGLVLTTGVQVWKNPVDDPHANQETPGVDDPIGRISIEVSDTGSALQ